MSHAKKMVKFQQFDFIDILMETSGL